MRNIFTLSAFVFIFFMTPHFSFAATSATDLTAEALDALENGDIENADRLFQEATGKTVYLNEEDENEAYQKMGQQMAQYLDSSIKETAERLLKIAKQNPDDEDMIEIFESNEDDINITTIARDLLTDGESEELVLEEIKKALQKSIPDYDLFS